MQPYYVYQIVDPRTGAPFYVGKGTGKRAWTHLRRSHNREVNSRIAEIAESGCEAQVEIVRRFDTDGEAIDFECTLICATDGLLNILAKGWRLTPEQERLRTMTKKEREFLRLGYARIDWCRAVIAKYSSPSVRFVWKHSEFNKFLDPDKTLDAVLSQLRDYVDRWEQAGIKGAEARGI